MALQRSPAHRVCEALHLFAAGVWLGTLVMAGVFAAIIFTRMGDLKPTLGTYAAYTGDHARMAAGYVQNRVFLVTDSVQFVAAMVCLATMIALIAAFRAPIRSIVGALRLLSLMGAISALSYYLLVLAPRMAENLEAFYRFASAGDNEQAETFRQAFDADHPTATNIYGVITVCVLVLFMSGLWAATGAPKVDAATARAPRPRAKPGSDLETPRLAKGAR